MTKRRRKLITLYRKTCILKRQLRWLYDDTQAQDVLLLYRKASRLRRRVAWMFWRPFPYRAFSDALKRIYADKIVQLFAQQCTVYDMLIGRKV